MRSAYVEFSGRTHVPVETEYDLLLVNRLMLQPLVEFEIYGRADPERGIDAGLSTGELGLRLRYEVGREFARTGGARLAVGVRFWLPRAPDGAGKIRHAHTSSRPAVQ